MALPRYSTWMGDHPESPGAAYLHPSADVDLNTVTGRGSYSSLVESLRNRWLSSATEPNKKLHRAGKTRL